MEAQSLHARTIATCGSCFTPRTVTRSIEVTFALAFHTEPAITAEFPRDGYSVRTTLHSASFDFIARRGSKAHDNIQLGFDRDLSVISNVTLEWNEIQRKSGKRLFDFHRTSRKRDFHLREIGSPIQWSSNSWIAGSLTMRDGDNLASFRILT